MNHIKTILLFLFAIIAFNNSFSQQPIDSLLSKLRGICEENHIPGAMISIVNSHSTIYAGGVGYANLEKKEKVSGDHLFRLGSISKSITALGIVKMVEEGRVSMSSTIDEIDLSLAIENPWKEEAPIRVEHILEHTAGFDDIQQHAHYNYDYTEAPPSLQFVNAHEKSLYARWEPGTRMAYSNAGYVLAGHLIEKIDNSPYHQYLKKEILTPLGMKRSGFYFKRPLNAVTSEGYIREGGKLRPIDFKSVQGGAASDFCSTAKEMSLFLRFMLSQKTVELGEEIISPNNFVRIENPKTTLAAKNGFIGGYGLGNKSMWANNFLFHGHDGGIDGFSSLYLYSREADFGLAVSINNGGSYWKIVDEILNFYLGKNKYQNKESLPISAEVKNKYAGFYNLKSPRNQSMFFIQKMMSGHTISFDENVLLVKTFDGIIRDSLYHKGNNQFYRKNEGVPFVMLLKNKNGKPVLWLGDQYAEKGNRFFRVLKNGLLAFCIFMSLQYFLVGFFWWLRQVFKKIKTPKTRRLTLWLTSFSLVLMLVNFLLTIELSERPDLINVGSIIVFLSSIAFFVGAFFSFMVCFKSSKERLFPKLYLGLTAVSLIVVAFWFLSNDFIGLRLWAH